MSIAFSVWGVLIIVGSIIAAAGKKSPHALPASAAAHQLASAPTINYSGNPNRIGAYVYVMEADAPDPGLDWAGTFIGMKDGMMLVRDTTTHVVAHVNRDHVYSAQR